MYKRTKEFIKSNNVSPEVFIEGIDYCNSELLTKLDKFSNFEEFTITQNEYRIDLISKEIYKDDKYSWLILYINRCSIKDLVRHKVLKFIPIEELNAILTSI